MGKESKKELKDNKVSNSSIEKIPAICAELLTIYNEIKKVS